MYLPLVDGFVAMICYYGHLVKDGCKVASVSAEDTVKSFRKDCALLILYSFLLSSSYQKAPTHSANVAGLTSVLVHAANVTE